MRIDSSKRRNQGRRILVGVAILASALFGLFTVQRLWLDSARLVSIQEIGDSCYLSTSDDASVTSSPEESLFASFGETTVHAQEVGRTLDVSRQPIRDLEETAPLYGSIAVDTQRDEVYLQDSNRWSIRVFGRLDNAKPGDPPNEPRRIIGGPKTELQFNSCVWVDPASGDIYSVENDTGDIMVVFPNLATGNTEPSRKLTVTHRSFAMVVEPETKELYMSVQFPPQIQVYSPTASGKDKPLRALKGDKTGLSDAHGIAIDSKNKLLFVNNWGNISDPNVPGSGRFEPPSITVYPLNANGNTPPLRIIQGPKTRMDWPAAMSLDPDTGDLYVANDIDQSIIVFHGTDQGDVAPFRVIKGPKTHLSYPLGVFVDAKNKEVWAANLGNSAATVYPLNANGDVAPLRIIRSAADDKVTMRFGKGRTLAYDTKREEILVPN